MAKPELGGKHICEHCGSRFFDLNRMPIACPKCGTIVEGAPRAALRATEVEDEDITAAAEKEHVPLEEANAEEEKAAVVAGDEVEIDTEDDTFLEEEEEDADVGDLIDSDIGEDEER